MSRSMHALVLGAALCLVGSSAMASTLVQVGQPDRVISVMQNYGVNVPLPKGLDTVVPPEWSLHVHADVPQHIPLSWTIGQDWPSVLETYAHVSGLSVLVSWSERAVSIRPASVAQTDSHKHAQLLQGATTPLPTFHQKPLAAQVPSAYQVGQYEVSTTAQPMEPAPAIAQDPATMQPEPLVNQEPLVEPVTLVLASDNPVTTTSRTSFAVAPSVSLTPSAASQDSSTSATSANSGKAVSVERMVYSSELNRFVAVSEATNALKVVPANAKAQTHNSNLTTTTSKLGLNVTVTETVLATSAEKPASFRDDPQLTAPAVKQGVSYDKPTAFSKPNVKDMAQGIANRFNMRLLWAAPNESLLGPITLFGNSVSEDVYLLKKALGVYSTVAVELSEQNNIISVVSKTGYYEPSITAPNSSEIAFNPYDAIQKDKTQTLNSTTPLVSALASSQVITPSLAPETGSRNAAPEVIKAPALEVAMVEAADMRSGPQAERNVADTDIPTPVEDKIEVGEKVVPASALPAEVVSPVVSAELAPVAENVRVPETTSLPPINIHNIMPPVSLILHSGEPLENALTALAKKHGFTVDWQLKGGFEAKRTLTFEGKRLADVLAQVLPPLQISADIYTNDSHIVIRPADAVLDR